MSLLVLLYTLLVSYGMDVETPEEFLEVLSSGTADQWVDHQCGGDDHQQIPPDSIRALVGTLEDLSVEPGEMELEDVEGGYRAVFQESRWTWRIAGGRIGSVRGVSVVEWRPGGYTWVTLPVFTEERASIGRKESLCMGATITAAIGLIGSIAVWYAKRRYG